MNDAGCDEMVGDYDTMTGLPSAFTNYHRIPYVYILHFVIIIEIYTL